ncbi:hypothetical protein LC612_28530 [Nostoc sp. CHAB 5834]|nr:hypothetical protein [Nostoc sp. CHAB 5834]
MDVAPLFFVMSVLCGYLQVAVQIKLRPRLIMVRQDDSAKKFAIVAVGVLVAVAGATYSGVINFSDEVEEPFSEETAQRDGLSFMVGWATPIVQAYPLHHTARKIVLGYKNPVSVPSAPPSPGVQTRGDARPMPTSKPSQSARFASMAHQNWGLPAVAYLQANEASAGTPLVTNPSSASSPSELSWSEAFSYVVYRSIAGVQALMTAVLADKGSERSGETVKDFPPSYLLPWSTHLGLVAEQLASSERLKASANRTAPFALKLQYNAYTEWVTKPKVPPQRQENAESNPPTGALPFFSSPLLSNWGMLAIGLIPPSKSTPQPGLVAASKQIQSPAENSAAPAGELLAKAKPADRTKETVASLTAPSKVVAAPPETKPASPKGAGIETPVASSSAPTIKAENIKTVAEKVDVKKPVIGTTVSPAALSTTTELSVSKACTNVYSGPLKTVVSPKGGSTRFQFKGSEMGPCINGASSDAFWAIAVLNSSSNSVSVEFDENTTGKERVAQVFVVAGKAVFTIKVTQPGN